MDTFEILSRLCPAPGVSGREEAAAREALRLLEPYGEGSFDPVAGNVIFRRSGWDDSLPTLLLDAHIDEIGLVVTYITEDGFLKVAGVGGVDRRVFPAAKITVYGTASGETVPIECFGCCVPPHLTGDGAGVPEMDELLLDTGYSRERLREIVALGDRALIENVPELLLGGRVTSKGLDDRSGCAALILALDMLRNESLGMNIAVMLSSQEEVGERGAGVGAFGIDPDLAIAVDVSFAQVPGEKPEAASPMGSGVMIGVSPSLSGWLTEALRDTAEECEIPYTLEVMSGTTGTNADAIGGTRSGVPTVTLSIPEKNMHTPAEIVSAEDIENTARLIAEYVRRARL